jgi:lactoylglutathione lyase
MRLIFDQVHLGVPDPLAGAAWYQKYLGAAPGDHADRVMFGRTRFIYLKNDAPVPSRDAAIGHVALSVPNLDAQLRKIDGSGGRVTAPPVKGAGGLRSCYIEDPWGASIEFVEDGRDGGVHHVQLCVPNPEEASTWYVNAFGGMAGSFQGGVAVKCADVWLALDKGTAQPSRGHTIDHIGYRMADLTAAAAELKGKGVTFTTEPHPGPPGPHAPALMSFIEDPWGVKIELLQRRGE